MSEINPTAVIKLQIGDPKPAVIPGKSMEFTWDGTRLGVRVQGDPAFQFVDIKGQKGDNLEYKWDGTKLGIRIQGQTNYSYVDLEGPTNEPFRLEMEQMLSSATGSASAAAGSASAANSSKVAAAGSATSAATSATNASGSATSAATSAGAAATSATSAARSANEGAESATSAQNSKSAAESARSSAATSAGAAATSATAAAGSATVASNAASTANTSKETALSAQTAAAGSANAANTHATIAQNARSGAETAQAGASNYAGFAQASATEAEKSKVAAAGSATAASNSATAAAGSATSAATSAGAAATSASAAETARSETAAYRLDVLNLTNFAYVENLFVNSSAGNTSKSNDATVIPNAAIAPDGGSAFRLIEGTANAEKIVYFALPKATIAQEVTFSIFLKPNGRTSVAFWLMGSNYTSYRRLAINLLTGNISLMNFVGADAPIATKASVIPLVDGWVRMSFTWLSNADPTITGRLDLLSPGSTYIGDGASGIYFYGPQYSYTKGPIPYLETVGQAMPKTYVKVLADSTLGGSNPSPLLPPSQKSAQDFANTKVPIARPISLASTNLTLAVLDASKFIPVDSPSAVAVTVPTNTAVAIPIGAEIVIMQKGNGPVSIAPSFGVNVLNKFGRFRTKTKGDTLTLRKIDVNDWVMTGDVTYPLDNVSAHSAWSIRRLSSTYTGPALRVRRSSDNAETDIYYDFADQVSGFSGVGAVNGPRLIDWAAGSTMFVKTIYNQGTSEIHFTNATLAEQPQLYLAGGANPLISARIRFMQDKSKLLAGTVQSYQFLHQSDGSTLILKFNDIGTDTGTYRGILQTASGNGQLGFTYQKNTDTRLQFAIFNSGSSAAFNQGTTNTTQGYKRFVCRHVQSNSPQIRISEDGNTQWLTSANYTGGALGVGAQAWALTLGAFYLKTAEFEFEECIIFNSYLSDADLALTR